MADFKSQGFSFSDINGGVRYEDGDIIDKEAINKPIEASMHAVNMANAAYQYAAGNSTGTFPPLSAYPIGSIYISTNNISPAESVKNGGLGDGNWERITDCFLLAAGTKYAAGKNGGSETHTHELSNAYAKIFIGNLKTYGGNVYGIASNNNNTVTPWITTRATRGTSNGSMHIDYSYQDSDIQSGTRLGGSTDKGNNMPPYLTVYMWKRIA